LIGKRIAVSPLAVEGPARAIVHPIDLARHDEIVLAQSFYLLGAQGNRHITPVCTENFIRVVRHMETTQSDTCRANRRRDPRAETHRLTESVRRHTVG